MQGSDTSGRVTFSGRFLVVALVEKKTENETDAKVRNVRIGGVMQRQERM
jgi:hypothetical protein